MCCSCRKSDEFIYSEHLGHLSLLQELIFQSVDVLISQECVPSTWRELKQLHFVDCNDEPIMYHPCTLPRNLSVLASLTSLHWVGGLQVTHPMHFVTQLSNLREVCLGRPPDAGETFIYPWSVASLCAIMQASFWIEEKADCHVKLTY